MPNVLSVSVVDHKADDIINWFNALEQGLFSTHGAGTEANGTALMTDASTMELRVDYVTIGGEVHTTGFSGWDEGVAAFTASFDTPEPLGFPVWTDMRPLSFAEDLLGDTRIKMVGNKGSDWVSGFDFNDRFQLNDGNDAAAGGDGNDVLLGGRGRDLLIGGADNDVLRGGNGHDMLIAGPGDDTVKGGGGNDVLVFEGGVNQAYGGLGSDIFIFDSFGSTASGSPNVLKTVVRDLDASDLLVLGGLGVSPDTIDPSSKTLDDVENGTIDDFRWVQKTNALVIKSGDAKVILRNTTADQVDLDMILFTEQTAAEAVELFDNTGTGGTLGYFMEPWAVVTVDHNPNGTSFIAFGSESSGFDTYGGDVSGFYLGAFPMA